MTTNKNHTPPSPNTPSVNPNTWSARVDYLSYTIPIRVMPDGGGDLNVSNILQSAALYQEGIDNFSDYVDTFECSASHGFYAFRAWSPILSLNVQWGGVNPHALFEWSGMGCEWLRQQNVLDDLADSVKDRVTRIDFAVDMITSVTPAEFVEGREGKRFKSHSSIVSETGLTEYVGSRTSDQMARVYRYHKPHPRAKYLRVEIELKHEKAKRAVGEYLMVGLNETCQVVNAAFGWAHPIWQGGEVVKARLPSKRHDKTHASTLLWLQRAVVPALKALQREEVLDIAEWFELNFKQPE